MLRTDHLSTLLYALTLALLLGWAASARAQDADGDGVPDAQDNCPTTANGAAAGDQRDADGDGIGDACECGDATGDGFVNSVDARLLQRCAVGFFACPELCDVTGEGACNSIDARLVQRFSVGLLAKDSLTCAQRAPLPVRASFEIAEQTVDEDFGVVLVGVEFDAPFRGTLEYAVTGSAGVTDFVAPPGTLFVPTPRTRVEIPVEILDDAELAEEQESIELRLVDGPGYRGGVFPTHTLRIDNNDRLWRGTLATDAGEIDLSLEILRSTSGGVEAFLRSQRGGLIPPGRYASTIVFDPDYFFVRADIALADDVVGTPSRLVLGLEAQHGSGADFVGPDQVLGRVETVLTIEGQSHLADRPDPGRFVLLRERSGADFAAQE